MIEQEEKKAVSKNSATYYMLPMLQLNRSSFGVGNFINCYVDESGYIVVDSKYLGISAAIINHPEYVTDFKIDSNEDVPVIRAIFSIPEKYLEDIMLYKQGKYSQLSSDLKINISNYSGLKNTDIIIRSLNPQEVDRQKLANDLSVRLDFIKEIKSAPVNANFIKIK